MTFLTTRKTHSGIGKRVLRYFSCRKARKLYNEINRSLDFLEARFLKTKLNHA